MAYDIQNVKKLTIAITAEQDDNKRLSTTAQLGSLLIETQPKINFKLIKKTIELVIEATQKQAEPNAKFLMLNNLAWFIGGHDVQETWQEALEENPGKTSKFLQKTIKGLTDIIATETNPKDKLALFGPFHQILHNKNFQNTLKLHIDKNPEAAEKLLQTILGSHMATINKASKDPSNNYNDKVFANKISELTVGRCFDQNFRQLMQQGQTMRMIGHKFMIVTPEYKGYESWGDVDIYTHNGRMSNVNNGHTVLLNDNFFDHYQADENLVKQYGSNTNTNTNNITTKNNLSTHHVLMHQTAKKMLAHKKSDPNFVIEQTQSQVLQSAAQKWLAKNNLGN